MSDAAKPAGRPMKYPYTYAAKLAQFPYKFYFKNSWAVRYWVYSSILCLPIFYGIEKLCKFMKQLKIVRVNGNSVCPQTCQLLGQKFHLITRFLFLDGKRVLATIPLNYFIFFFCSILARQRCRLGRETKIGTSWTSLDNACCLQSECQVMKCLSLHQIVTWD